MESIVFVTARKKRQKGETTGKGSESERTGTSARSGNHYK